MKPPFADIRFAAPRVDIASLPDGSMILRSAQRLEPYCRNLGDMLEHWGTETPDAVFLAERAGQGWRRISYGETLRAVRAIAQALIDRKLSAEKPVVILSDNSIDHALVAFAAMHVGIPVAPISPAYSLMSKDFGKLKYALELIGPGLIFVADATPFAAALKAVDLKGAELVASSPAPEGIAATALQHLLNTRVTSAVDSAREKVGPDTIAKILLSSGSTDMPKGVITTQRMLCSNQQAIYQIWPFLSLKPPVLVDWLPWNHTFGGSFCLNLVLRHGGTMYVDDGKPAPHLIAKTIANLREISPTLYFNVPRGYDMLLPHLENDEALRSTFFRRLDMLFYAAAALPPALWGRLEDVAIKARGVRVAMIAAWGATETAPGATIVHFPIERAGYIGLPVPGCEIKLVPNSGRLEIRARGHNITPGYWKRPDLTEQAFDEEGYFKTGDAGRFAEPDKPEMGLEFDGRSSEDFKLTSGTWVNVGSVRLRAISAGSPVIQDAVVTGHNQDEIGLLVFPNFDGCRTLCADIAADAPLAALIGDPRVRAHIEDALRKLAEESSGGSTLPTRVLILEEPPSTDANEITDKGYINQRAVLMRRAALVERLHARDPDPEVIVAAQLGTERQLLRA
ncbi:MAG: feruloyl-CoA synthase [Methylobacteriaceae bacterium]|jgi:feruloyl-CoA synthase|nr:feruloyl-CoA synthase [Methylobacteriaceae bacterium]